MGRHHHRCVVLLAAVLIPIAIKALFYFVLAPLAARRPPIQLLPEDPPDDFRDYPRRRIARRSRRRRVAYPRASAVRAAGFPAKLRRERPHRYQVAARLAYPFTSLAAGMHALTRVRSDSGDGVVVSSTRDPLSEVGVLALPEGTSFVLQPRSLAGVIHAAEWPLRITSKWRLTSLHAWLTLQLRYLVFHGPADLIVKGSRGVRVERAGGGNRISQAATIGFGANLRYRTTRCETFASYLLGQRELLIDSFEGDGYYAYQEVPERRHGIFGRGLQGLAHAASERWGLANYEWRAVRLCCRYSRSRRTQPRRKSMKRRDFTLAMATLAAAPLPFSSLAVALAIGTLKMMVPANPGGGWDQTGRELGKAMQAARSSRTSSSTTRAAPAAPSASRSSSTRAKGDPNALMVGGMVMVGGIVHNKSPVDARAGHADRAAHRRVRSRSSCPPLAVKTLKELVDKLQGEPGQRVLGRRHRRRHRPHPRGHDREGRGRRSGQGQLRAVQGRRGSGRGDPRRPRHRRRLGPRRVRAAHQVGQDARARDLVAAKAPASTSPR